MIWYLSRRAATEPAPVKDGRRMAAGTAHCETRNRAADQARTTLVRGAASAGIVKISAIGVMFACHLVLARVLGVHEYGVFAVARSWIDVCALLAVVGIDSSLVRFVSQYRVQKDAAALNGILRWGGRVPLMAGSLVGAVFLMAAWLFRERIGDSLSRALMAGGAGLPLLALVTTRQAALRGFKRAGFNELPLSVIRPLLLLAGVLLLPIVFSGTITAVAAMGINIIALLAALAVAERYVRREVPPADAAVLPRYEARRWLGVSAPMLLDSTMRVAVNEIDVIVIGIVLGPAQAGIYAVALNLARLMAFGLAAGNTITAPLISELNTRGDRESLQSVVRLACGISTGVALAVGLMLVLVRSFALDLFGEAFQAGSALVLILAAGQFVNAATGPVVGLLNMTGLQTVNLRITVVIALLNVGLSYPAIRWFGMEGAAALTGGLVAIRNLWCWWEVRKRLEISALPALPRWQWPRAVPDLR